MANPTHRITIITKDRFVKIIESIEVLNSEFALH